ncbi:hypothetical protein HK104_010270, partial [Borealophlyctis nickersoniae]
MSDQQVSISEATPAIVSEWTHNFIAAVTGRDRSTITDEVEGGADDKQENFYVELECETLLQQADSTPPNGETMTETTMGLLPSITTLLTILDHLRETDKRGNDTDEQLDATLEKAFTASVALLGSGDSVVRAKVGNELLPSFLTWDGERPDSKRKRGQWCRDQQGQGQGGGGKVKKQRGAVFVPQLMGCDVRYEAAFFELLQ